MSILTKVGLSFTASITGLGFYSFNTLLGNPVLISYAVSLMGTAATAMLFWEYRSNYKPRPDNE